MEDYGKDMERIEHANIDQHEAPVAVDMGYPARTYYHHAKDSDWSVKFLRTT